MSISGKYIIIGILSVALAGAGASWWFRYAATNRTATFWGPANIRLIRDAPVVELYRWDRLPASAYGPNPRADLLQNFDGRDISHAPGLVHLRNALLEDRSYEWPPENATPGSWGWVLMFRDERRKERAVLFFDERWTYVSTFDRDVLSCKPIAEGLRDFFAEATSQISRAPR